MKYLPKKDADWQEVYRQALFEADTEKLEIGIEAAHRSVQQRICALWEGAEPPDIRELTQLGYACHILALLSTITEHKKQTHPQLAQLQT